MTADVLFELKVNANIKHVRNKLTKTRFAYTIFSESSGEKKHDLKSWGVKSNLKTHRSMLWVKILSEKQIHSETQLLYTDMQIKSKLMPQLVRAMPLSPVARNKYWFRIPASTR